MMRDNQTLKIELLSQWKLEAEFRKKNHRICFVKTIWFLDLFWILVICVGHEGPPSRSQSSL